MADAIEIPKLSLEYGRILSLCGRLKTQEESVLDRLKGLTNRLVAYRSSGEDAEALVLFGGGKADSTHLHFDILRYNLFERVPEKNATLEQLQEVLNSFQGQAIRVVVAGGFRVPVTKLPKQGLLSSTMLQAKVGEIGITQTASTLEITGSEPVRGIEWSMSDDRESIEITLDLVAEMRIDEAYVSTAQRMMDTAFRGLVLGGETK